MIYEFDGMRPEIDPSAYISESATVLGNVRIAADVYVGPGAIIRGCLLVPTCRYSSASHCSLFSFKSSPLPPK